MNGGVRNSTHNEVTHARATWDECELDLCQPLSQCSVRTSEQGNSQGTLTQTKRKRDNKKQTSSAVVQSTAFMSHWMYSWVSSCFSSFYMLLCLSLCTSCHQFNCCQCTKLIHFLTYTGIPCRDSHCENGLVRCCLYTPRRLQQTAVRCTRSNCNKIKNLESRTSEVLSKDGTQRVLPFYHVVLHVSSFVDFLLIIMSSIRNRSIATNWRKNLIIGAIFDTSRMALA